MINQEDRAKIVQLSVDITTKLALLAIILYISYLIVKPFLAMILWGIILAVAFSPVIDKLADRFGHRKKIIIATGSTLILALVASTWLFSDTIIDSSQALITSANSKEITIPAPTEKVKSWPLIGEKSFAIWQNAHDNLPQTLKAFSGQIKEGVLWLVGLLKGALTTILLTIASIVIASIFLISKDSSSALYERIMIRLVGAKRAKEWVKLSASTVRSVATGVVGVAIIQSFLALIGMIPMGIPLAPLWALSIMFLTIIQLPAFIVIAPMIAYAYSISSGAPATIFAIYMLLVGASDGVLKPMLMGRGVDIPMIVILIGAIGGMMLMGMIGLFLGSIILALSYKLFEIWLKQNPLNEDKDVKIPS